MQTVCVPVPLAGCIVVHGYTVVAATLDHKGADMAPGCTSFDSSAYGSIANQGAALCTGNSNCAGFTTFQWGGQAWACPKATLQPQAGDPAAGQAVMPVQEEEHVACASSH